MMKNENIQNGRVSANRILSILAALAGICLGYYSIQQFSESVLYGLTYLLIGFLVFSLTIKITIDLGRTQRVMNIMLDSDDMDFSEFMKHVDKSKEQAYLILQSAFRGKYIIGYLDGPTDTILLKTSMMFNEKEYARQARRQFIPLDR